MNQQQKSVKKSGFQIQTALNAFSTVTNLIVWGKFIINQYVNRLSKTLKLPGFDTIIRTTSSIIL